MAEYVQISCRNCGCPRMQRIGNILKCPADGFEYEARIEEDIADKIQSFLDKTKREKVDNLRKNLCDLLQAENTDSSSVVETCRKIRSYLPDDFNASFYEVANAGSIDEYARFLYSIDLEKIKENAPLIEGVVAFTAKSLEPKLITPLSALMTRYKEILKKDKEGLEKYSRLQTLVEDEKEKVNSGYYFLERQWDVCILYSSKDMEAVLELLQQLEASHFTCFAAFRNLKHGRGAKANYQKNIETAMENSKVIVFVSSENSRSTGCDAIKFELPHIKHVDIQYYPEHRDNYLRMPQELRKPRIEYRLDGNSGADTVAEGVVEEFFHGLEQAYDAKTVAERTFDIIYGDAADSDAKKKALAKTAGKVSVAANGGDFADISSNKAFVIEDRKLLFCDRELKGRVIIPDGVKMIGDGAFENCEKITKVIFSKGVTAIGQNAFKGCRRLEAVVLSQSVKEIGESAFDSCISLSKVVTHEGLVTIRNSAFQNCQKLQKIEIPSSVTEIGADVFNWCKALRYVYFVSPIKWVRDKNKEDRVYYVNSERLTDPKEAVDYMNDNRSYIFIKDSLIGDRQIYY